MPRAAVELGKEWRLDKYLRRLEAMLAVVSKDNAYLLSGNGDVIEPEHGIIAAGTDGNDSMLRLDHVAVAGKQVGIIFADDGKHRFESAEVFIETPFFAEFDCCARHIATEFLQLVFEF